MQGGRGDCHCTSSPPSPLQTGQPSLKDRRLAFLDRNKDLYLTPVQRAAPVRTAAQRSDPFCPTHAHRSRALTRRLQMKLATMVDSFAWCDSCDALAAVADGKLVFWLYPNAAFIDTDLLKCVRCTSRHVPGEDDGTPRSPPLPLPQHRH